MSTRTRSHLAPSLAAILVGLASTAAHAQRPTLTRSLDKPGRSPDHEHVAAARSAVACRFAFKEVPAGFRLTDTHVSLSAVSPAAQLYDLYCFLSDDPDFPGEPAPDGSTNAIILAQAPKPAASALFVVSSPETSYVDPEKSPNIVIGSISSGISAWPAASINGYLVVLD